ncbi:gibberellin 2-beta-dioxygenase 6 [Canna indica]|uniref:Gibberellin 2-beta-dioxygenase 6 n=1 Tax=Canna indica TaxID=4628 RepID=A0AAQ3QNA6_9LILI|nr:gibberellin 2-beta-dioxygenase 6 [Canna indica]
MSTLLDLTTRAPLSINSSANNTSTTCSPLRLPISSAALPPSHGSSGSSRSRTRLPPGTNIIASTATARGAKAGMVIASVTAETNERIQARPLPVIDLSWRRGRAAELLVRACEEFGFFKVVNHGVPRGAVARMEAESARFFALPAGEKLRAGPPSPLGYGIRNIGFHGDMGELEYLLLHSNASYISHKAKSISRTHSSHFSGVVNEYVKQVRQLACELLEMLGEGMGLEDSAVFSRLLRDTDNDSLLRLNHYPPPGFSRSADGHDRTAAAATTTTTTTTTSTSSLYKTAGRVGFGEHSDPQILSILRSNDVDGLQIRLLTEEDHAVWVPVPADPTAFYVNVGDALQAQSNGQLLEVKNVHHLLWGTLAQHKNLPTS